MSGSKPRVPMRSIGIVIAVVAAILGGVVPIPAYAVNSVQSVVVSADPVDWTPNILDGQVNAIVQMGTKVIVGGTFTQVRRAGTQITLTRNSIFAFDMLTGVIDPNFVPQLGGTVSALAASSDGSSVFVGGVFSSVNGNTGSKNLVRLQLADGQLVSSFAANTNGLVEDLTTRNGWLYASGKFTSIKNTPRSGLARLDETTGAVDPNLNLPFTDPKLGGALILRDVDVSQDGSKLVAVGNFSMVGGIPRNQVAVLDLTTTPASVSSWQTDQTPFVDANGQTWCSSSFQNWIHDVDISPDGTYFVLGTTGAFRKERLCDTVTRWDLGATGPGQQPTWVDWTGGDTFWSVTITSAAIYVGGHQRWVNNPYASDAAGPGAIFRQGIAALDPINGLPFSWNPTKTRGVGVFSMPATTDGLWVGSDTDLLAGEFHQKIGMLPVVGGATVPPNNPYTLPNDLYNLSTGTTGNGNLSRRTFDGVATFGTSTNLATPGIDWRNARGAFVLNGSLYTGWNDGKLYVRSFDGATLGAPTSINLNGLTTQPPSGYNIPGTTTRIPALSTQLASATGMFFSNGRIYYTVSGDNRLYYRYFTPESQTVGANLFVASTSIVPWNTVQGMTMASGSLYYADTLDRLWRVAWNGTAPTGTAVQIGTSGWSLRGLFAFNQTSDTLAPTVPGKPSGTSGSTSTIDLTWSASHDNVSPSLTYRIYRDGNPTPIDQVTSTSTTTVTFTDNGLDPGSIHTYQVDAVDAASNMSAKSASSDSITVAVPDTTPPTDPGIPTGTSVNTSSIDLSWTASSDAVSSELTYRIYRDDPGTLVGTVASSSTTTVSFSDKGLAQGSSHMYWVEAIDAAGNASGKSQSAAVQVQTVLFADDFSSGDFSNWTGVTRLTIDGTTGGIAPPSARAEVTNQSAFAFKNLTGTFNQICMSTRVNAATLGTGSPVLLRLRTAGNGPISRLYMNSSTGVLWVKSDVSGTQVSSGVALGTGWHNLELCGTVGASGTWDLYRDGAKVVNAWTADTGTTPVGRVEIGDATAKTMTINFDDVVVDQAPGGGAPDVTPPTTPGKPTGQSLSQGTIHLSWAGSTDQTPPITYRVYRDGDSTPIGSTSDTSFADGGLTPGSIHTYTVDAVDLATNVSPLSPVSDPIAVIAASTVFADDFSSNDFSNWTSVTRLTIDGTTGPTAPSALGNPAGQTAFAYRDLATTYGSGCLSVRVNVATQAGASLDLLRLRTAGNGPISKVFADPTGVLYVRSDFAATQFWSGARLLAGWNTVELCGTVGSAGAWDVYLNATKVVDGWIADTGSTPIGRIQIGDSTAKTWTADFDDVVFGTSPV